MEVDTGMTQTVDNRKLKSTNASNSNLVFQAPTNLKAESHFTSRDASPAATPIRGGLAAKNKSGIRAKTPGAAVSTAIPQQRDDDEIIESIVEECDGH